MDGRGVGRGKGGRELCGVAEQKNVKFDIDLIVLLL